MSISPITASLVEWSTSDPNGSFVLAGDVAGEICMACHPGEVSQKPVESVPSHGSIQEIDEGSDTASAAADLTVSLFSADAVAKALVVAAGENRIHFPWSDSGSPPVSDVGEDLQRIGAASSSSHGVAQRVTAIEAVNDAELPASIAGFDTPPKSRKQTPVADATPQVSDKLPATESAKPQELQNARSHEDHVQGALVDEEELMNAVLAVEPPPLSFEAAEAQRRDYAKRGKAWQAEMAEREEFKEIYDAELEQRAERAARREKKRQERDAANLAEEQREQEEEAKRADQASKVAARRIFYKGAFLITKSREEKTSSTSAISEESTAAALRKARETIASEIVSKVERKKAEEEKQLLEAKILNSKTDVNDIYALQKKRQEEEEAKHLAKKKKAEDWQDSVIEQQVAQALFEQSKELIASDTQAAAAMEALAEAQMDTEQWLDELDAAEGAPSALSDAPQNAASAEAPVPVLATPNNWEERKIAPPESPPPRRGGRPVLGREVAEEEMSPEAFDLALDEEAASTAWPDHAIPASPCRGHSPSRTARAACEKCSRAVRIFMALATGKAEEVGSGFDPMVKVSDDCGAGVGDTDVSQESVCEVAAEWPAALTDAISSDNWASTRSSLLALAGETETAPTEQLEVQVKFSACKRRLQEALQHPVVQENAEAEELVQGQSSVTVVSFGTPASRVRPSKPHPLSPKSGRVPALEDVSLDTEMEDTSLQLYDEETRPSSPAQTLLKMAPSEPEAEQAKDASECEVGKSVVSTFLSGLQHHAEEPTTLQQQDSVCSGKLLAESYFSSRPTSPGSVSPPSCSRPQSARRPASRPMSASNRSGRPLHRNRAACAVDVREEVEAAMLTSQQAQWVDPQPQASRRRIRVFTDHQKGHEKKAQVQVKHQRLRELEEEQQLELDSQQLETHRLLQEEMKHQQRNQLRELEQHLQQLQVQLQKTGTDTSAQERQLQLQSMGTDTSAQEGKLEAAAHLQVLHQQLPPRVEQERMHLMWSQTHEAGKSSAKWPELGAIKCSPGESGVPELLLGWGMSDNGRHHNVVRLELEMTPLCQEDVTAVLKDLGSWSCTDFPRAETGIKVLSATSSAAQSHISTKIQRKVKRLPAHLGSALLPAKVRIAGICPGTAMALRLRPWQRRESSWGDPGSVMLVMMPMGKTHLGRSDLLKTSEAIAAGPDMLNGIKVWAEEGASIGEGSVSPSC